MDSTRSVSGSKRAVRPWEGSGAKAAADASRGGTSQPQIAIGNSHRHKAHLRNVEDGPTVVGIRGQSTPRHRKPAAAEAHEAAYCNDDVAHATRTDVENNLFQLAEDVTLGIV